MSRKKRTGRNRLRNVRSRHIRGASPLATAPVEPVFERLQQTAFSQPEVVRDIPELLRDESLPQLAVVRDESAMRAVLQGALFGAGTRYRVEECIIAHVRYRPHKRCLIAYLLEVRDTKKKRDILQRLSAKVLPSGLSQDMLREARRGALVASSFSDPVLHLPDLSTVVWLFPNDPRLHGLPALVDERRLEESVLANLAAKDCGPDWTVVNWHTEIAGYNPEHRCTLRAVVQVRHIVTGELRTRSYYGKAYPDDHTGRMTERRMKSLLEICSGPAAPFFVAQPLLYEEEWRILWQSGIVGTPLSELRAESSELLRLLKDAGRVVAALHSSNIECPETVQPESARERLARAGSTLSCVGYGSADLLERLIHTAPSLKTSLQGTVHRDLHLHNIISTGDGIALIDLDALGNGDPLEDLASFLAHVYSWSFLRGLDAARIEPAVRAIVRSYAKAAPWSIGEAELRWHLAAALVFQACHCITRPEERRLATLNDLLQVAEEVSNEGSRRSSRYSLIRPAGQNPV